MKKLVVCAVLATMMALCGCAGGGLYRGVDTSTHAFVSTAYPPAAVQPAEDFRNVSSGKLLVRVPENNDITPTVPIQAWYALYASEKAQLAVLVADCSPHWIWILNPRCMDYQYLPVLRSSDSDRTQDPSICAYVRPCSRDPWMPVFADAGSFWEDDCLVARYEWCTSHTYYKLVVEYREPLPVPQDELGSRPQLVTEFLERAKAAFSLNPVPDSVARGDSRRYLNISDRILAPVIGAVEDVSIDEDI